MLGQIVNCTTFLDDIIVSASSVKDHLVTLDKVLKVLEKNGLSCKKEKCEFFKDEILYLGQILSEKGIKSSPSNVEAIVKMSHPLNISELQCFLEKTNFYSKFINNYFTLCEPLNLLRRKGVKFFWGNKQQKAFEDLKGQLIKTTMLTKFDPSLPLILSADASSVGLGVVMSHKLFDGSEVPIAHTSKTLNIHQRRYSQVKKEDLAIVYGLKKFNQFL